MWAVAKRLIGIVLRIGDSRQASRRLSRKVPDTESYSDDSQDNQKPGILPVMENETANECKRTHTHHQNAADLFHIQSPAFERLSSMLKGEERARFDPRRQGLLS